MSQTVVEQVSQFAAELRQAPTAGKVPADQQELVYAMAYNLVAQGQYAEALRYFALLNMVAPTDTRFLSGLGLCHQMLAQYDQAIMMYSFAGFLEPEVVQHTLAVAECQIFKGDLADAKSTLHSVLAYCELEGREDRITERARALLGFIVPGGSTAAA
jgi:type III secretion system low calcium response chaperone LcrH/SycD